MSSDAATATLEPYTFRQLDTPADGPVGDVADVLSAAYAQAEEIRRDARLAGEAEGREAGAAAVRAEAEPALRALADASQALHAVREQVLTELESDAVLLAMRLAEQIVAGAIDAQPERLVDIAGLALRRIADRRHVTLVVNPADLDLMNQSVQQLQTELGGIEACHVQSDRRVGRGGIIARTDAGEIDATVEAQISRAGEIVTAELARESDDA